MPQKIESINTMKLIMAAFVVALHTGFAAGSASTFGDLTIQGLFRLAVPFFFLASGFFFYHTLTAHKETTWLRRLLKLYVVWSMLYLPLAFISEITFFINNGQLIISKKQLAVYLIFGYWQLWFLPALIIAAMVTQYITFLSIKRILLISLTLYITGTVIQYMAGYHLINRAGYWANDYAIRNALFLALPFFITGYKINENYSLIKNNTLFNNDYFILFNLILLLSESLINSLHGRLSLDFMFTLPLAAVTLFLFCLRHRNFLAIKINTSALALDIYLIHVLILSLIQRIFPLSWPTLFIMTFSLSILFFISKKQLF